jgi:hypothetical protein
MSTNIAVTQTETIVDTVEVSTVVVTGLMGPPGVAGPQGPTGPQGTPGIGAGNIALDDLIDVAAANPVADSTLVYSATNSNWVASTQIVTYQPSIRLQNDWVDTTIKGNMLETGTYFIQLFANDIQTGVNGTNNNEYYSGIMSWYSGDTNSSVSMPTDEIALHRAGASGEGGLFLRTYRTPTANPDNLKLQIYSNTATDASTSYTFKFKRIM